MTLGSHFLHRGVIYDTGESFMTPGSHFDTEVIYHTGESFMTPGSHFMTLGSHLGH